MTSSLSLRVIIHKLSEKEPKKQSQQFKGINISVLKTKLVMFTWNRKWNLCPVKVGGRDIELTMEVKLLGVTLDNRLNFNSNIQKITSKCIGILMQCKHAIGPNWGLTPKVCKWIYTAIICPILSYSVVVWIRGTLDKNNTKPYPLSDGGSKIFRVFE